MLREAQVGSDLFFRVLIEHSPEVIVLITADGTITYASPSITHLTGYTCQEVEGMESLSLFHPDDHEHLREHLTNLTGQAEKVRCLEHRWRCKDGTWRWMESTLTNLLEHPQVGALVCTGRDITKRKQLPVLEQATRELLDSERKLRSLVESNSCETDLCGAAITAAVPATPRTLTRTAPTTHDAAPLRILLSPIWMVRAV